MSLLSLFHFPKPLSHLQAPLDSRVPLQFGAALPLRVGSIGVLPEPPPLSLLLLSVFLPARACPFDDAASSGQSCSLILSRQFHLCPQTLPPFPQVSCVGKLRASSLSSDISLPVLSISHLICSSVTWSSTSCTWASSSSD